MVTLGRFIEFEHAIPKMARPSPRAIVMVAGDTLTGTRLAREVAGRLAEATPRLSEIAGALSQHYVATRRSAMEQQLLQSRGLDLTSFYGRHAGLNAQITMMLDQQLAQFDLGVELLLAGIDGEGGHIFTIENPGAPERQHDVIGYAATGSGAIHALQSMIGFGHHAGAPFRDTLFRVYASKRRAEAAPGVGQDTDLLIVSSAGISTLDAGQLSVLGETYSSFQLSTQDALTRKLQNLSLEILQAPGENGGNHG